MTLTNMIAAYDLGREATPFALYSDPAEPGHNKAGAISWGRWVPLGA